MNNYFFEDIVNKKDGFLRGPFGGALKKEIFVKKGIDTYKVYEQGVVLNKNSKIGNYYITKSYYETSMVRFTANPKDILVSCSGVNYGAIYQLPDTAEIGVINQALLRIRLNNEIADDKYFIYLFENLISKRIIGGTGDSTIPNFPPMNVVRKIPVELPNLITQKKIATVLSALDDKIELNNSINADLEQMAKTLYDYWFVQFDFPNEDGKPYKSSGGKMVYNKVLKREIPEGWTTESLYKIADFINGLACQKYRPLTDEDEYLPVIKIREMNDGLSSNTEKARVDVPIKNIIDDGDVLFSWSATLDIKIWTQGKGVLNQHIFKVVSDKYPRSFYYFEILNYLQHFKMMAELRKTTMGHITLDHLRTSFIAIPPMNLINQLDDKLNILHSKIITSKKQNQELASLRDWLLPMLMNGQVKVVD
ncbi:restriction endonuclease subunit S [Elizabethkingia anophelis]|uniref:restriction endonuclease subunit S n=1 Tax=Elizabethkingia anophelis TaxID=1117645 RepID=UPI0016246EB3|nr:restriction endonuclease subunit S [Elizabethkingia anophelis]MCT3727280.1 restriction endonuclease subunit S [Elizabethkingia anophelis]